MKIRIKSIDEDSGELSQHEPGAKLDSGKILADLVVGEFAPALTAVAEVGTFGAKKYSRSGWLQVEDALNRYADARMRHYLARKGGEECDPESGLPHLYHEAWNVLAELTLTLREEENKSESGTSGVSPE